MSDGDPGPSLRGDADDTVLVVGAGPTGLLLAAELRRRGIACHLVDAHPGPLHWDRATVMHPRSLELFESLGLAGRFLAAGVEQRMARLHSGRSDAPHAIGTLAQDAAARLGVEEISLLVVRPDGHVGLRADRDPLERLASYQSLLG